jgi:hemolysin-activating ACP:hemolysin acyltransferase
MFGRSKSRAPEAPAAEPAANGVTGSAPSATAGGAASTESRTPQGTKLPQDPAAGRRAATAVRHSLAFAQIVSMLMRSQQHKRYPIATLEWLVIPPLLTGQFSIAEARSNQNGASAPVAVALWARVSPEVDKRLSENLDKPMQLRPREWRSGDILWLVEAVGAPRVLPQFLKHLTETTFKGREVKVRSRGADGKPNVSRLGLGVSAQDSSGRS